MNRRGQLPINTLSSVRYRIPLLPIQRSYLVTVIAVCTIDPGTRAATK
jgi:hypothetical protein